MTSRKEDRLEDILSRSRNFLRGKLDFVENRNAVLILVFLKLAQYRFILRQQEIVFENGVEALEDVFFYHQKNVIYLETEATWNYLLQNMYSEDVALMIDNALSLIEKNNPMMLGVFPERFFSSLDIDSKNLVAFIEMVDMISPDITDSNDIIGRVYEYYIKHFAMDERKIKGEYFTPKSIVDLMVEIIEPFEGVLYDPCIGTGGLFLQSEKLRKIAQRDNSEIHILGQENNREIWRLAKLNFALRGINIDLGRECISTFKEDIHKVVKADYILANPPFNLRSWQEGIDFENDERFLNYNLYKNGNANYAWILHILSKLKDNAVAGIVLSNSPLSSEEDLLTRQKLIEEDKIEAIFVLPREMFYSTDIGVSLWILNNNKGRGNKRGKILRNRKNEILFVDLRKWNEIKGDGNFIVFSDIQIKKAKEIFYSWRCEGVDNYSDIPELCKSVSVSELRRNNYSLSASVYIDFEHKKTEIDFNLEIQRVLEDIKQLKFAEDEYYNNFIKSVESIIYGSEQN